ncbi:hypothetical protein ACFVAD_16480 [Sutcliffiella sp. NPDC057660]|uniref:hypothetical protein n=1 Tax=Sutcliffiella sp. NPDC057660 TaxID=3346199 RepID=UPI0036C9C096
MSKSVKSYRAKSVNFILAFTYTSYVDFSLAEVEQFDVRSGTKTLQRWNNRMAVVRWQSTVILLLHRQNSGSHCDQNLGPAVLSLEATRTVPDASDASSLRDNLYVMLIDLEWGKKLKEEMLCKYRKV